MTFSPLIPLYINEVKDVLFDIRFDISTVTKNVLNMANSTDPVETPRLNLLRLIWVYAICECSFLHKGKYIYPYKPSVLFVGHRQTVQNQIRCRKIRHLIMFSTVCKQKFLLKFE